MWRCLGWHLIYSPFSLVDFFIRAGAAFTPTESRARSLSALQMSSVQSVHAREILDSRGNPTVEVRVVKHLHLIGIAFVL